MPACAPISVEVKTDLRDHTRAAWPFKQTRRSPPCAVNVIDRKKPKPFPAMARGVHHNDQAVEVEDQGMTLDEL